MGWGWLCVWTFLGPGMPKYLEARARRRLAGAALVEEDDVVHGRVKVLAVARREAAARSAVQEDCWLAALGADLLVVPAGYGPSSEHEHETK